MGQFIFSFRSKNLGSGSGQQIQTHFAMYMFEIGVLGFGGENEVVEKVFDFRNKVYFLSKCYFIILNIKFIIWYRLLKISNF